ncbi:MAG: T9SS type A sorting domain-containing protein [bacterium]|nr:T9SS type A sorting domain-containing protein [bacterium]
MKKLLLLAVLSLVSRLTFSQTSATIAIQFYVDANNNCTYNPGEQLVYNLPFNLAYAPATGTTQNVYGGTNSLTACGAYTLYVWNPNTTPTNTLSLYLSYGVLANLSCSNYTNIPYNTNTIQYLPVTITGTASVGTQVNYFNYYSSSGTYTYGNITSTNNVIGICSNIGNDSIAMYFNIFNYFNCTTTASMSPRTYSLYLDGVNYDILTTTGGFFSSSNVTGVNAMSKVTEYYQSAQTYLYLYPKLPTTFTALGSHTFAVKSSMIYNNPTSVVNFSCILNSIPCTKISGRFYNDCNNNCVFDGVDNYSVGWFATGKLYNATSGYNVIFHPNWTNGRFSVYAPASSSYSLTQYPTYTTSPYNFTACSTGTLSIPAAATTNTFMFGYKNNISTVTNPGVYLYRTSSTSNVISPGVGATFAVQLYNSWWNVCASSIVNPGKVKVTLPKFINYVSMVSGPSPTVVSSATADTLIWTVPNFSTVSTWWLSPYASFSVVVSATAVPNATFNINTTISPAIDISLSNNSYNFYRTIGGPFDPNEKITEAAGLQSNGDVPLGTQQFYYTIGFQNIGNAPAINVKTLDTLDANFDLNTLEVLQSSFPVSTQIDQVARLVLFNFEGINLPASTVNEPKSHGFVRYGIKLKAGVPANTVLKNRAHNYFDFNAPVPTNQTANTLIKITGITEQQKKDYQLKVMPNPFNQELRISAGTVIREVTVYNSLGQVVHHKLVLGTESTIDLNDQAPGIYILNITLGNGEVVSAKAIKN